MTTDASVNLAVARPFYDAFETGDVDALDRVFSPDWVDRTLPVGRNPGLAGMKEAILALRAGVPDLAVDIAKQVSGDDLLAVHLVFTGTHTGTFLGLTPTGAPVRFIAFDLHHITDGRIVESWHLEDNLAVLTQMGMAPASPGPGA